MWEKIVEIWNNFLSFLSPLKEYYWAFVIACAVLLLTLIIFIIVASVKAKKRKKRARLAEEQKEANAAEPALAYDPGDYNEDAGQVENYKAENEQLFAENEHLSEENEQLKEQVKQLKEKHSFAQDENEKLRSIVSARSNAATADDDDDEIEIKEDSKSANTSIKYTVKYDRDKNSWVIKKDGTDRVVRRVTTKEEAMKIAKDLSKKYNADLVVHKKDGKFQKLKYD